MDGDIRKAAAVDNFSRYASSYDDHAGIQKKTAGILLGRLPEGDISDILEIGCGTGNYTLLLKDKFEGAGITAIDISGAMIEIARQKIGDGRVDFIVGDAVRIDPGGGYQIVTSNAAFQWLGDPGGIIKKTKDALADKGTLAFSSFGPGTFLELKSALSSAAGRDVSLATDFFPAKAELEGSLRRHFKSADITERLIRESYPSLRGLLTDIKYSGTRGPGADMGKAWSPGLLKKIEDKYLERFGAIEATYQVFFCEGRK